MEISIEKVNLFDEVDVLTKMVLSSEVVENYLQSFHLLQQNKVSLEKVHVFSRKKQAYEEVQRFGFYHPDYKRISKEVRDLKREMDMDPLVMTFKKHENELQELLDEISIEIAQSVSKHIFVPSGNPFFDSKSSHKPGCGGGGSCGCSA